MAGSLRLITVQGGSSSAPAAGTTRIKEIGAGPAVEIIFDGSGSMDGSKLTMAKKQVNALIDGMSSGYDLAIRVFGPVQTGSNQETGTSTEGVAWSSTLVTPLAPVAPSTAKATIDAIPAQGGTPIGESLRLAGTDLKDAKGQKVVILITDGDSNGDEDPLAAVQKLNYDGVDAVINIIGIDLPPNLRSKFQRIAEAGNGRYFDGGTDADLRQALQNSVGISYGVYTAGSDTEVASGSVDGDAIDLTAGQYDVILNVRPRPRLVQNIDVTDSATVVEVPVS